MITNANNNNRRSIFVKDLKIERFKYTLGEDADITVRSLFGESN